MWPLYVTPLSRVPDLRLACSSSRVNRSPSETLDRHYDLICDLEDAIADTAQALMVVSGLKFHALVDLHRGEWLLFQPPGDPERRALLQEYSLAAEQDLDHFETLQLVCEMRYLGVGFYNLRTVLNEKSDMLCLMNLTAWPPQAGRFSDHDRLLEIGPATVAKWECVAAREEDLKRWQAQAADVIDRATEMLRGKMDDVGRGTHDSTTLRRRR